MWMRERCVLNVTSANLHAICCRLFYSGKKRMKESFICGYEYIFVKETFLFFFAMKFMILDFRTIVID